MEADDMELVRDYARNHSEQAFRTLVERHVNMVFAVALRQTEKTQLAEEVTQVVFSPWPRRPTRFRKAPSWRVGFFARPLRRVERPARGSSPRTLGTEGSANGTPATL
jgi:DNA-directed RNA polymerase specialized sigma24 family protein